MTARDTHGCLPRAKRGDFLAFGGYRRGYAPALHVRSDRGYLLSGTQPYGNGGSHARPLA
jgi:hypothetical protein